MKENNSVKKYSLFYFYVSPSCDAIITSFNFLPVAHTTSVTQVNNLQLMFKTFKNKRKKHTIINLIYVSVYI